MVVVQHPRGRTLLWPCVDPVLRSTGLHINHGIISLMLKWSFVHRILLALTWVADNCWQMVPPPVKPLRTLPPTSLSHTHTHLPLCACSTSANRIEPHVGGGLVLCMCVWLRVKHLRRVCRWGCKEVIPIWGGRRWSKQYAQHFTVMPEQSLKAFYNTRPKLIQDTKKDFFLFFSRREGL